MADKDESQEIKPNVKPKRVAASRPLDVNKKAGSKPVAVTKANPLATPPAKPAQPLAGTPKAAAPVAEPTAESMTAAHATSPKTWLIRILILVVAVVVIVAGIFAVLIYALGSTSQITYAVSGVLPFPAERVNGHFVSYHDYLFEVNANQKAYVSNAKLNNQTPASWTSAAGKKMLTQIKQHALTKLEGDVITEQLASKYKVTVTDSDVNNLVNTLYQKYGGKDTLLKTLSQIYGWNLNDLKHVIRMQLLSQKVQAKVASDPAIDAQTKAKATAILAQLKGGADFAATAKSDSQASDASSGGDLGTVAKGQVEDAVYTAASGLQPGDLSGVIKTQYGYQIIKVIDKSDAGIHLSHILIEPVSFTDYFAAQEKAAKVKTFVKA